MRRNIMKKYISALFILAWVFLAAAVFSQTADRLALVIGNSNYAQSGVLKNPVNDAADLASALKKLGFEVMQYSNITHVEMIQMVDRFGQRLAGKKVGLFYFAGHGAQAGGENYLFPVDADPSSEYELEYECVNAGRVIANMQSAGCSFNIVILDACRNNPFERSWNRGMKDKGLASINAPVGTLIAYATSPGNTAADNPAGRNGLYTSVLLGQLQTPGLKIEETFKLVRSEVQKKSNGQQIPWETTSLIGDFYFKPGEARVETNIESQTEVAKPLPSVTQISESMVYVEGGTFQMGGNQSEDEKPIHTVTVSRFYISKYEVTFNEYDAFCDATGRTKPQIFDQPKGKHPMLSLSWYDAVEYCNWRSQKEGLPPCYTISGNNVTCNFKAKGYRLPIEAEWEYAARGGKESRGYTYSGSNIAGDVGWYNGNSGNKPHPVGKNQANELGIHDMSGNVLEWCWDWYDENYYTSSPSIDPRGPTSGDQRVLRGGCWYFPDNLLRTAFRCRSSPDSGNYSGGFRLSRTY